MQRMKMGSACMCWAVGLWIVFVSIMAMAAEGQSSSCVASSCGKITNISHPFRRKDDPPNCGDSRYEIECVNDDVAMLRLSSNGAEYRVESINYNNYTIRLVDPNIEFSDCSSLPRYFLSGFNFSCFDYESCFVSKNRRDVDLYHDTQQRNPNMISVSLFEHIIYMSCNTSSTVNEYSSSSSSNYVEVVDKNKNNSSCLDLHSYVVIGNQVLTRWKPGCSIKLIAATSGLFQLQPFGRDWWLYNGREDPRQNISYSDIHKALVYGFELSWMHATCNHCGSRPCYFNETTRQVLCFDPTTYSPPCRSSGWRCRVRAVISSFAAGLYRAIRFRGSPYNMYDYYLDLSLEGWVALIAILATKALFGVTILVLLLIYKWRKRHLSRYVNIENFLEDNDLMPIRYSYREIKKMTKNFKVKLGQGGFGSVYKGKLRSGPHVAIKMLKQSKANGQEFINEVATIGRIHHLNVVRLIGFCVEGTKRALVYDFMSNGSLDKYIFSKEGSSPLSYEKIYEISLGVTCGISYLHEGCNMQILHFDIKPHNILLDENFIPKVSDFGLAKLYPIDHSIVTLTDKRGTIGYIAPELFYNNIGGISTKADVYSFGMLLMEMANRRKNLNPQAEHSSQIFFPTWVYDQFGEGKEIELDINGTEDEKNMATKMIIVALWCIQLKPSDRPSMKRVVEMLEGELEDLIMPPKPLLYPNENNQTSRMDENLNSEQGTSDHSTSASSDFGEIALSHGAILDNSLSGR